MSKPMDDGGTCVAELRALMARFVAERSWEKFHDPKNLAASILIEAAELMEHFQWVSGEEADAVRQDPQAMQLIREEVADVLAYLLSLCNRLEIDLSSALAEKMEKNAAKYPADRFKGLYRRPQV